MENGKLKMESGKWKMESGKWKMESWKWKVESWKWKVESGKLKVENGKWKIESWKWKVENGKLKIRFRRVTRRNYNFKNWYHFCGGNSAGFPELQEFFPPPPEGVRGWVLNPSNADLQIRRNAMSANFCPRRSLHSLWRQHLRPNVFIQFLSEAIPDTITKSLAMSANFCPSWSLHTLWRQDFCSDAFIRFVRDRKCRHHN